MSTTKRLNIELHTEDIELLKAEIKQRRKMPMRRWMEEAIREKLGRESIKPGSLEDLSDDDYARVLRFVALLRSAPARLKRAVDLSVEILEQAVVEATKNE